MTAQRRPGLHIRPIGFLAAAILIVVATWTSQLLGSRSAGRGTPVDPPAATRVPAAADPAPLAGANAVDLTALDRQIAIWSAKAAQNENDYISATNLGVLYLSRARLTGDVGDYDRATQAVARALEADPGYTSARALDAVVRYATHDFTGALASAERLLADEPDHIDALTVVADAELELGRLDEARRGYDRLAELSPGPALDVRLARLAYVTGEADRSLALARAARDRSLQLDHADGAFYDFQLGEFARLTGDATLAREAFAAALEVRPQDRAALVGRARVDAAEGRLDEAIDSLLAASAIAPEPGIVALLGDLLAISGDPAAAEQQYETVRLAARLGDASGGIYDRQLLLFELDHGGASNDLLARAEDAAQTRTDAAGLDLVAWALHRLGRHDEALTEIDRARAAGIVDARILFHAGAIALALGDEATGRDHLRHALALGPALDPIERHEAEKLLGSN
jgi:tetratricopeptide (TPR) repeat protein